MELNNKSVPAGSTAQTSSSFRVDPAAYRRGRLSARPVAGRVAPSAVPGVRPLGIGLSGARDGLVYVPADYSPDRPAPLVVMLHGAGGNAERTLASTRALADKTGAIVVVPESRGVTWDIILEDYGPDVERIDRALAQTFLRYAIDPARVAIAGFSDGASYALSIGLANGDLFRYVLAFSPGFVAALAHHGAPRLFISHGVRDEVLSITRCSRRIVPALQRSGYDVVYREFDGPHTVPQEIAEEAMGWLAPSGKGGE
jgi:phospholipase/carboxylesterase